MKVRCTLKKNSDFRRLYSKGKSAVTPYLVVYCRRNRTGENRLGYTVSTKLGHAVVRNRVRRRLREIYRLNAPRLKEGYDIIIVARGRCVGAKYSSMDAAFMKACENLGLEK
ncbi:MAG: ribonuclease P protein component [Oscillospiraceae bacterium]|nr:ribonuclease P protein component [Oscillospiraceae bacterium]